MSKLRVIYAGTPEFAIPALQALIDSVHEVVAVYTQPDRPAGRGRKISFGPVKQLAVDNIIPVEQPLSLKDAAVQKKLADYEADVMVVAAYGLILPQIVLDTPKYGCLNIHGSLLPRWRGAAPIQRAIQAGDNTTGVTIMQMAAGLDTGDMLLKKETEISATDTAQSMHDRLANDGAKALMTVLEMLQSDTLQPEKQDENEACYAQKLSKEEAEINWHDSAISIDRLIRAFNPWPVAFTKYRKEQKEIMLRIFMSKALDIQSDKPTGTVISESAEGIVVATGEGVLSFSKLQMPGKKAMSVGDFLNAHSLLGQRLGRTTVD